MRISNEPAHRFGAVSLTEVFGDLGAVPARPRRHGALRLLRTLAARIAAWREREAVARRLSAMSDRELADIGLGRSETGHVFDPRCAPARAEQGARALEEQVLAELGLSRTLPRPTARR